MHAVEATTGSLARREAVLSAQTQQHRRRQGVACRAAACCCVESDLRTWIASHGGFIHSSLQLVEVAPMGCRGVIAAADILLEDLEQGPLIIVPQQLQFDSSQALAIIRQHCGEQLAATAAQQLAGTQLLAAALAHELACLGSNNSSNNSSSSSSSWTPYIQSLPAQPPNPWLLSDPEQISACIQPYAAAHGAAAVSGWQQATAKHRSIKQAAADAVTDLLGTTLQVSSSQVLQALGHVDSRALTSLSRSSGLLPFIDMLNHKSDARAPMLQLLDDDDLLVTTVLPIRNGEAVPLLAGEELCISYQGGYTPLQAFLKFGFVAHEWW